jgi:glycosyltransferase involved in cell wall biosynthesis
VARGGRVLKVLYVNHTLQKSGAGISLATLLRHLPAEIEPHFLLPARSEIDALLGAAPGRTFKERWLCQFPTTLYNAAYPPHLTAWHLAKMPLARWRIGQLVRRWKIDVVHLNETVLVPYATGATPVLMHARTAIAPRRFERGLLARFGQLERARIAAIDGEVKASLPEPARAVTEVVYNPIDLGPAPSPAEVAAVRIAWGCTPGDLLIGQVASLHRPKGIWLILDLAEKLCAEFPALRFVLIGDDSAAAGEGPPLRAAIAERGLTQRVLLPGYDARLATVYAALDVALCLFGGGLGGVGRAAYEAAIAARPLVATLPDPQRSETLRHGESGLLFTPDDTTGLADALRQLIRDTAFRTRLGASARAAIAPRHDPTTVARRVAQLYEVLAAQPGRLP